MADSIWRNQDFRRDCAIRETFPPGKPSQEGSTPREKPMGRRFAELAFTPLVKKQQTQHGSRHLYERVEHSTDLGDRLGPDEQAFLEDRDGFYMGSVTES